LEQYANESFPEKQESVTICPWHWLIIERKNRYPFTVPTAVCNCQKCNAHTIFDNPLNAVSRCTNNFILRPVMFKDINNQVLSKRDEELWLFGLERVPISCSCSVKVNVF